MKNIINYINESSNYKSNEYISKYADEWESGNNSKISKDNVVPSLFLYNQLKNNRYFYFDNDLPENELYDRLKTHKGNVEYSYVNNGGGSYYIYKIKFLKEK